VVWYEAKQQGLHYRVKQNGASGFGSAAVVPIDYFYNSRFDVAVNEDGLHIASRHDGNARYAHLNLKENVWSSSGNLGEATMEFPKIYLLNDEIYITGASSSHCMDRFTTGEQVLPKK